MSLNFKPLTALYNPSDFLESCCFKKLAILPSSEWQPPDFISNFFGFSPLSLASTWKVTHRVPAQRCLHHMEKWWNRTRWIGNLATWVELSHLRHWLKTLWRCEQGSKLDHAKARCWDDWTVLPHRMPKSTYKSHDFQRLPSPNCLPDVRLRKPQSTWDIRSAPPPRTHRASDSDCLSVEILNDFCSHHGSTICCQCAVSPTRHWSLLVWYPPDFKVWIHSEPTKLPQYFSQHSRMDLRPPTVRKAHPKLFVHLGTARKLKSAIQQVDNAKLSKHHKNASHPMVSN